MEVLEQMTRREIEKKVQEELYGKEARIANLSFELQWLLDNPLDEPGGPWWWAKSLNEHLQHVTQRRFGS